MLGLSFLKKILSTAANFLCIFLKKNREEEKKNSSAFALVPAAAVAFCRTPRRRRRLPRILATTPPPPPQPPGSTGTMVHRFFSCTGATRPPAPENADITLVSGPSCWYASRTLVSQLLFHHESNRSCLSNPVRSVSHPRCCGLAHSALAPISPPLLVLEQREDVASLPVRDKPRDGEWTRRGVHLQEGETGE